MNAIGYVRVSTSDQATEGVSLAAQRARLESYCCGRGWTLSALFEDAGASRPGLLRDRAYNRLSPPCTAFQRTSCWR